jgi:hypothetical protein
MIKVTQLETKTRRQLGLIKIAETLGRMADLVTDPEVKARLKAKAAVLAERVREL